MTMACAVVSLVCGGVLVSAQQLPVARPAQPVAKQPVVRPALEDADAPVRPAPRWSRSPDGVSKADDIVTVDGPGARIRATTDVTLFRPQWTLTGTFTVAATFHAASATAMYGLTLGGASGLAFVARNDGSFSIQAVKDGRLLGGASAPVGLRVTPDGAPGANRLEVRVGKVEATFLINAQPVRTVPLTGGLLDGVPGVHIGVGGDVSVSAFTVQGAAAAPGAGTGK
ncbi:hypothetical protein BH18ACI5_BH18ACI5_10630 [soil metagenome]